MQKRKSRSSNGRPARKARRLSNREFADQATKIIVRHLSKYPPEEQDLLLRNAERSFKRSRGGSSTTRKAAETQQIHL